ncbi:MAG: glycosyltransferase family 1 protein [Cyanobacteria bacterium P01_G01_bin.19]
MSDSLLVNLSILFDQPTGIATYAQNVVKSLSEIEPILLSPRDFDDFKRYSIPHDMAPNRGSRGHFKRLWWTQFQLPKIYQELKGKLIFTPIPEAPLYSDCRYVAVCHDLIPLRFPRTTSPLTNYFRYVVPRVLEQAEHIICNSNATAGDIVDFYGIKSNKITPILLGYDRQNFYPRKEPFTVLNRPYFLYLGRQDYHKNLSGTIAAFAGIKNTKYCLAIAGSKDRRFTPQLERQIKELEIQDRVAFFDYLNYQELPKIISNAVALIFPTLWEGFGLPVLEAMACGTPVIASNLASLPEIIGDAGMSIDPYDTSAITSAMIDISTNSQMRNKLSELGLKQARKFSWQKTGEITKEVLLRHI